MKVVDMDWRALERVRVRSGLAGRPVGWLCEHAPRRPTMAQYRHTLTLAQSQFGRQSLVPPLVRWSA